MEPVELAVGLGFEGRTNSGDRVLLSSSGSKLEWSGSAGLVMDGAKLKKDARSGEKE